MSVKELPPVCKHSPGPWKWRPDETNPEWLVDANGNTVIAPEPTVAAIWEDDGSTARLIAAAPEMLELLRRVDAVTPEHPPGDRCGCVVCDTRALLKRIDGV